MNTTNKSTYGLTRRVLGCSSFFEIPYSQYKAIKTAHDFLVICLSMERKYDNLLENYLEFENTLNDLTTRDMIFNTLSYSSFQNELNLCNRKLTNTLASGNTYIITTTSSIGKMQELDPEICIDIKSYFSSRYDNSIGYRAMEALRNYTLHNDFAIQYLSKDREWLEADGIKALRFAISPYVVTARLLEDKRMKQTVAKELVKLGDKVDIKSLVREYITQISMVHADIRDKIDQQLKMHDGIYTGSLDVFRNEFPNEPTLIGLAAVEREGKYRFTGIIEIHKDLAEYRNYFVQKNPRITNMQKRHISGEIIKKP